jgi:hypothetical protein
VSFRRDTRCVCRDYRSGPTPLQLLFSTANGAWLENLTLAFARRYPRTERIWPRGAPHRSATPERPA